MSHITRGLPGNREEDWVRVTVECNAKTCDRCMLTSFCVNPRRKVKETPNDSDN